MGMPAAEVQVDSVLVHNLLLDQHPDLADDPLRLTGEGWDNFTFRLGHDLAVRIPRRQVAVPLIRNEQVWLPALATLLPIPVPTPVRVGEPSDRFHWPWSVVRWLSGAPIDGALVGSRTASQLAVFLRALHRPAPVDAPVNPFRGGPLHERTTAVEQRLQRLGARVHTPSAVLGRWEEALAVPATDRRCWIHGDLHSRNVLVEDGGVSGVIDWGDLAGGDPATDLAGAWTLIESPRARGSFLDSYQPTEKEVARGRGWAIVLGSALADSGEESYVAAGLSILRRVGEEGTP